MVPKRKCAGQRARDRYTVQEQGEAWTVALAWEYSNSLRLLALLCAVGKLYGHFAGQEVVSTTERQALTFNIKRLYNCLGVGAKNLGGANLLRLSE